MVNITANFTSKNETKCECGLLENMKHIYECKIYSKEDPKFEFQKIYNGNLNEQKMVFNKFKENMQKREKMKDIISHPSDQFNPLLFTVRDK